MCGISYSNEYISPYCRRLIWKQLVEIVAALQRSNIAHMDLKPGNIIRVGNILKVCDLGISKYGSGVGGGGTPNYSAPEAILLHGQFSAQVDIWSIGAILFYITYGKQPNVNPENRSWEPPYGHCPVQDSLVQDLLVKTLQHKPENRPNIQTLQRHPYTVLI
ncbi:unnamed protein product [Rotaria sp. Silwood2]|nr:unnamed protein product [Rotaria sp. Silwood2]CAF4155531.1 unnamed protein product [Rotaria sp. Silwood2]